MKVNEKAAKYPHLHWHYRDMECVNALVSWDAYWTTRKRRGKPPIDVRAQSWYAWPPRQMITAALQLYWARGLQFVDGVGVFQ